MAVSGFEGFEKRLELHFSGDDPALTSTMGLRRLDFSLLEQVLHVVQCSVVSAVANQYFDAYVLSESSLFIYPTKIIIKTCGTTQLLKSIRPLIHLAKNLNHSIITCKYTRGNFIFPQSQPFPHTSFSEEVSFLEDNLPDKLSNRKASVMNSSKSHAWHVFTASVPGSGEGVSAESKAAAYTYTVEVCMTDLDRVLARRFFGGTGNSMTEITGIYGINPKALICDFEFDPCGYSMNGIDGDRYSTIHVTPEDGFSYASFECVGSVFDDDDDLVRMLKKVVKIFRPGKMSVATSTSVANDVSTRVNNAMKMVGMRCRSFNADDFPASGNRKLPIKIGTRRTSCIGLDVYWIETLKQSKGLHTFPFWNLEFPKPKVIKDAALAEWQRNQIFEMQILMSIFGRFILEY
ncbi:S-adenosylmethionine decarboxylase [Dillenia turbinata]|uniref:adenosylmethionine decarboxylase n=1 Tax=Dillenia turbinata TaxID=194707 RepID=A0AAN8V7Z3_9MAGN